VDDVGSAAVVNIRMASVKEKAQGAFWFYEMKSPLVVQRNFRHEYGRQPPDVKSIAGWYAEVKETGNVSDRKRPGRPSVSEETVDAVRDAFQRSQRKSPHRASHELCMPQSTVVKMLRNGCVYAHANCNSLKPWSQMIIPTCCFC
jgi:hypothetical protein